MRLLHLLRGYKTLAELKAMDPGTKYSDASLADKMLRGANLSTKDHTNALMWSHGATQPTLLENVLRHCYGKQHMVESKNGRVMPRARESHDKDKGKPRKAMRPFVPYRRRFAKRAFAVEDGSEP
jgi:hypothetical protein